MGDDSIVQIMQSLGLDYNPAINSTVKFEKTITNLQTQLITLKATAGQTAKDINASFSSELNRLKSSGLGISAKDVAQSKTILDQYGNTLVQLGKESEKSAQSQAKYNKELQELIHLRKTQQIDAQTFVNKASPYRTDSKSWEALQKQEQVKLVSELTKAETEHRKVLSEKLKIDNAINAAQVETVKEVKKSTLASMDAQAATIQQKASAKGLSEEYKTQAALIRNQISTLQQKLATEGKLSAEEVRQTAQLKEQLSVLKSQQKADITGKSSQNANIVGNEFSRRAQWFTTGTLFYGVINGAQQAVKSISDVEAGVTEIARVMEDSSFVFNDYRDSLLKFGVDYSQTFDNVQDIASRWAQAGYNVADSLENTKTSLLALNTAELDAKASTEDLIGIMAQWKLTSTDLPLLLDEINKTADDFTVTSQDLVDGLLRSSGAARIMGLSIEQTISLLTVMREASGRTGREVGNALNSILSYVQRPIAIKTFEGLGIQVFSDAAKTQFRNVMDIFQDVSAKWPMLSKDIQDGFVKAADDAGLYSEELATAIGSQQEWNDLQTRDLSQAAAGVYRRNYFIGMIERLSGAQDVLNNMTDAAGYSQAENERTMDTLAKKYQSLQSAATQLAVSLGDSGLTSILKALADAGTGAIEVFGGLPKELQDFILATTGVFVGVKAVQGALSMFGVTIGANAVAQKAATAATLADAVAQQTAAAAAVARTTAERAAAAAAVITATTSEGLAAATATLAAADGAAAAAAATLATAQEGVTVATASATAASKAFILTNPILLGIAAIVGGIALAWGAVSREAEKAKKFIENTKSEISSLSEQKQGLQELSKEYETLKTKQDALTATADEKLRLLEVQKELVSQYGVSITGINSEGQAYSDSIEMIKLRTKAIEDEITAEQKKLNIAVQAKDSSDVRDINNNINKRTSVEQQITELETAIQKPHKGLLGDTVVDYKIRGYKLTLEEAKKYLVTLNNELITSSESLVNITKDRQQLLQNDATATIKQIEQNGTKVSDSARLFASEFAKSLSLQPKDIQTQRDALNEFIGQVNTSDFDEAVTKYNDFKSKGDSEGIDSASKSILDLVHTFASGKPELDNFVLTMESAFGDSSTIKNASGIIGDAATALDMYGKTADEAAQSAGNFEGEISSLNQIMYDLANSQDLSAEQLYNLIDKYPELADNIIVTAKGYKIEESALEELRITKINEHNAALDAEASKTKSTLANTTSRLSLYSTEVNAIKDLESAMAAFSKLDLSYSNLSYGEYSQVRSASGLDNPYANEQEYNDAIQAGKKVIELGQLYESIEKKKELIGKKDYGVSTDESGKNSKQNEALQNALDLLEHRKSMSEETIASIQSEIAELKKINSIYAKSPAEHRDMEEKIYEAGKRLKDKKLQDVVNYISDKKALDQLSAQQEIATWEKVLKTQKNNSEAVKQATQNIYSLKKKLSEDTADKEISNLEHWAKLGAYSIQQQIDKYRELYRVKALSVEDEYKRTENLFGLYKDLLSEQKDSIKDAYDERIQQIENEAKASKQKQQDIIDGIEAEEKALDQLEGEHDYANELSDLKQQLAYWKVRTSEDARQKVIDLNKQILEKEHDHQVELDKQSLENKKQTAEDEIDTIEKAANTEKEKWEKSYKLIEKAFDEHSLDIVAMAGTMSQKAYQKWVDNYLTPMQNALNSGSIDSFETTTTDLGTSIDNLPSHDWGMSNADYLAFKTNGNGWAALKDKGLKEANNAEMQKLHAANDELRKKYGKNPDLGEYPKFHGGGKALSDGNATLKKGEIVFPPNLSAVMERAIAAVKSNSSHSTDNSSNIQNTTDRRIIFNAPLYNSENTTFEDDTDEQSLAGELQRAVARL